MPQTAIGIMATATATASNVKVIISLERPEHIPIGCHFGCGLDPAPF